MANLQYSMFGNVEIFIECMRRAYRCAYRDLCKLVGEPEADIRSRAVKQLQSKIDEFEKTDIEAYQKRYIMCNYVRAGFDYVEKYLPRAYGEVLSFLEKIEEPRDRRALAISCMRGIVRELGEVVGDGLVQSHSRVMGLPYKEARDGIIVMLALCEGVHVGENDFAGMLDKARNLMIGSIDEWVREMKNYNNH